MIGEQTKKTASQNSVNSVTHSYLQPRPFAVQAQAETTTQGAKKSELQSDDKSPQKSRINLMDFIGAASNLNDPPKIQPKLEIGEVGDKYEQEADRVASQVVSQINQPVQKKLQRLSEAEVVQRREERTAQRKAARPFIRPFDVKSKDQSIQNRSTESIQRKFDQDIIDKLEKHIGSKASQQKLVSGEGHGQGMAEQLARGGDGQNENVDNFAGGEGQYTKKGFREVGHGQYKKNWKSDGSGAVGQEAAPEVMSQTLMNLVRLTKYDDTASASVLELANGGQDLQDEEMWNLIVVNSKFMSYIQTGMTINKIIPDSTVQNVLNVKQNDPTWGTSVAGSVAHEKNYDQGLTGEEATANFGLDYGGYKADTLKADGTNAGASDHSSYVYDTAADNKGRTLKAVPNVFYMKVAIPTANLDGVKVPVHGNVKNWAASKLLDIQTTISDPVLLTKLSEESGAKDSAEMLTSLSKKIEILTQFIERAKVDDGMLTTLTADQKKNKEDPLTNMGMTKPSSRLQTSFGTVNQEYHIARFNLPDGSGLWLKDATGVDTLVGQFIPNPTNSNKLEWGNLNEALIGQKLAENAALRT